MADEQFIDNIPENSGGAARYAGQSFLFGFGDELEALFKTGQISGEEFEQARRSAVESANRYENENPNKALAIDAAGFAPVVAGMVMSAPVSVPAALTGLVAKTLQKVGPTGVGALGGFIHGYGIGEPDERLSEGATNAVLGAGFGLGLSKAAPPVIRFLGNLKSKLSFKSGSMYR